MTIPSPQTPKWSKRVFHCYRWDPVNGFLGDCFKTEDISVLNEHQKATGQEPWDARKHLLDVNYYDDAEGTWLGQLAMCLPDAVINLEEGTVKHFLDVPRRGQERE